MKLAIPSDAPGGLEARLSPHFGHCDAFTLVELDGQTVAKVEVLANSDHQAGGCLAPVQALAGAGVNALVAGGMGARPLAGFQQAGIDVYFSGPAPTVSEAVRMVASGQAPKFGPTQVCGGGEGHCGHH